MKNRVWIVFLLLLGSAAAQFDAGTLMHVVRVRVAFSSGVCGLSTQVRLVGHGGPVAQTATNDQCVAEFVNLPTGSYHIVVSGDHFADVDSGEVVMDAVSANEFEVKVRTADETARTGNLPGNTLVSAADLAVPAKAQHEFDKANELIAKQNLNHAIERLNKAIAIYPAYAGAYNNLGTVYARMGDRDRERAALEKAVSVNDRFAPAYLNLGRLDLQTGKTADAETALRAGARADPTDAMTLVLLTYACFMNHHYDQAIEMSKTAHALASPHAFAHQIAARAYEQNRDGANAAAELERFLQEEPTGQRADGARNELTALRNKLSGSDTRALSSALSH